ncbi:hypothetical protein KAI87_06000, partial [Myxococcota bacterium]|nr:hypothetical protein [Myxococcota bacterium]
MTNAFLLGVFFMTTTQPQIPVSLTTMISSQLVVAQADDEAPSKEGRARPPRPGMGTRRFMGKKGVRSAVQ